MLDQAFDTHELGYSFFPPGEPHEIGHPQLQIIIRPTPTEKHFDPEIVTCTVAPTSGGTDELRVHHPWVSEPTYRVCAGHVLIEDRKGKQVAAFTFGGALHIDSNDQRTMCRLTSPAPILQCSLTSDPLEVMLGEEVEILFAERRAAWLHDEDAFDKRLAAADPLALYQACLRALRDKFEQFPKWEEPIIAKLIHFLHTTLPHPVLPSLVELL